MTVVFVTNVSHNKVNPCSLMQLSVDDDQKLFVNNIECSNMKGLTSHIYRFAGEDTDSEDRKFISLHFQGVSCNRVVVKTIKKQQRVSP